MREIALILLMVTASYAKIVTIIDNGVERKIELPTISSNIKARVVNEKKDTLGIVVAFKKDAKVDIEQFANRYDLELKKKLLIGYYVFVNKSALSDIELIYKISKENRDTIKTVRPNWGLGNKPQ